MEKPKAAHAAAGDPALSACAHARSSAARSASHLSRVGQIEGGGAGGVEADDVGGGEVAHRFAHGEAVGLSLGVGEASVSAIDIEILSQARERVGEADGAGAKGKQPSARRYRIAVECIGTQIVRF